MTSTRAGSEAETRPFLDGIRVLDITLALAGPYCTTILSDLGADVVKVEPVGGESMRRRSLSGDATSLPFAMLHRNKGSLAIDLKAPEGQRILRELARSVDVLVQNFRAGALERLGLGYDDLAEVNPNLVYCSISGFGQVSPMREVKGIDLVAQAYGGLMSVTGTEDGQLAKAGFAVGDIGAGMWGTIGVLAALHRARSGGGGAHIDVSLADSIASWALWEVADFVSTGEVPGPLGTAHRLAAPYQAFDCADGLTLVIGAVERQWSVLCDLIELPGLGERPEFATEYLRFRNHIPLAEVIGERLATKPRDEWIGLLREAGVPCGPVNTIDALLDDPHYASRGMFVSDPERYGQPMLVNTPILSDGAPRIRRRAPELGESTVSLLRQVGLGDGEIADLVARGVVSG